MIKLFWILKDDWGIVSLLDKVLNRFFVSIPSKNVMVAVIHVFNGVKCY